MHDSFNFQTVFGRGVTGSIKDSNSKECLVSSVVCRPMDSMGVTFRAGIVEAMSAKISSSL